MADVSITRDAVETAARALVDSGVVPGKKWDDLQPSDKFRWAQRAKHMLDAAAPLIEAAAFERVANNVDTTSGTYDGPCTTGFKSGQEWFKKILQEHAKLLRAQS